MPDPPKIVHDLSDQASYSRVLDRIRIPEMRFHKSPDDYFSTLYHEICHNAANDIMPHIIDKVLISKSLRYGHSE
jgi:antirestriction protein ArdC